jgi:RNA polymerase sigma factor (sigma-70 family)
VFSSVRQTSLYSDQSDQELVDLYISGDHLAAQALVLRYKRHLYLIARTFKLEDEECGDVIQDVWLVFLKDVYDLRDHAKLGPWLTTILKRKCLAVAEQKRANLPPGREVEEPLDPGGALEEIIVEAERRQVVREAVEKWPNRCRTLLTALYYDQLSYEQAGVLLELSPDAIGKQRSRCLEQLRWMLLKRGFTF